MRVFVLCAGRCGSTTLSRAFSHCTNFTVGHETHKRWIGAEPGYPDNHIEIDNRLSWRLGNLFRKHTDKFIHLTRDDQKAHAESFAKRYGNGGIIDGYIKNIRGFHRVELSKKQVYILSRDFVFTHDKNIAIFLNRVFRDQKRSMSIERWKFSFPGIWNWLGCEGDLEAAMEEFNTKHNAS